MSTDNNNDEMTPVTTEASEQPQNPVSIQTSASQEPVPPTETDQTPEFTLYGPPLITLSEEELATYNISSEPPKEATFMLGYEGTEHSQKNPVTTVHTPWGAVEVVDVIEEMFECAFAYQRKECVEEHVRYPLNDIGIGNLFADMFKDNLRFVKDRNQWYTYDGGKWGPESDEAIEFCKDLVLLLKNYVDRHYKTDDSATKKIKSVVEKWLSLQSQKMILKEASSVESIKVSSTDFDKDKFLLNCRNCTLDLSQIGENRKIICRKHRPDDLLSKIANVEYNSEINSQEWRNFMRKVMSGDKDKGRLLQQAMGYALTGDTRFECFFILYGPTSRNGKGTTMETFLDLMGDYGRTVSPDTITQKQTANGSGPSEDLARLSGARFVNISEPDENMKLSSALIKTMTGGNQMVVRYLFENSFEDKPSYKIFIDTNYLPTITDPAIFKSGRIKVIPYNEHFEDGEQDKDLKEKLKSTNNKSGILNWCLDGLFTLMKDRHFVESVAVKESIRRYHEESDTVSGFIRDCLEKCPGSVISTKETYEQYVKWCTENSFTPDKQAGFSKKMESYAVKDRKRIPGSQTNNPKWVYLDYKFKDGN